MPYRLFARCSLATVLIITSAAVADRPVVELTIDGERISGIVAGSDTRSFHLIREDGRLETYAISVVESFRSTGARFRPANVARLRSELLEQYGRDYEVATSNRYVVVAPRGRADDYLKTLDDIARTFTSYFSKRGVPLTPSPFPLVAIIFGTEQEFADYARAEGVPSTENVAGCYLRTSNRVAAFEPQRVAARSVSWTAERSPLRLSALGRPDPAEMFNVRPVAAVGAPNGLRETLIHEATHQMAFNTGLHSRVGHDPKWVVEGLATLFEPDAVRKNTSLSAPTDRINHERLAWFESLVRPQWESGTLLDLIASDRLFQTDPGDAYSLSWALSFYMNETQSGDYSQYLARLKSREHIASYTEEDRLNDFRLVFGRDFRLFEAAFLRFMDGLPAARR